MSFQISWPQRTDFHSSVMQFTKIKSSTEIRTACTVRQKGIAPQKTKRPVPSDQPFLVQLKFLNPNC